MILIARIRESNARIPKILIATDLKAFVDLVPRESGCALFYIGILHVLSGIGSRGVVSSFAKRKL